MSAGEVGKNPVLFTIFETLLRRAISQPRSLTVEDEGVWQEASTIDNADHSYRTILIHARHGSRRRVVVGQDEIGWTAAFCGTKRRVVSGVDVES